MIKNNRSFGGVTLHGIERAIDFCFLKQSLRNINAELGKTYATIDCLFENNKRSQGIGIFEITMACYRQYCF